MTIPRRIVPGQNHMISRRCVRRQLLLTPCKHVTEIVLYALTVAVERHGILLHAIMVESNHYHLNLTDPNGKLPEFERDFDQLVARALNAYYGRGEAFWRPGSYSNVEIHDRVTLIEKLVYIYSNPVKDGLVATPEEWPGLRTLPEDMGVRTFTARKPQGAFFGGNRKIAVPAYRKAKKRTRAERLQAEEAKRRLDEVQRKRSSLPEVAFLAITPPPLFADLPLEEIHRLVRERLDGRIKQIHCELPGKTSFMGAEAVRRQDPFSSPGDASPAFERNPRIACTRNARLRTQLLTQLRAWRAQYRLAYQAWNLGNRGATFPYGTYALRVFHAVRTADPPPTLKAA